MLSCTSVLSSVLISAAKGLGELLYAILHICAVICAQTNGLKLRRAPLCCSADLCSGSQLGFGRDGLSWAAYLCCISALTSGWSLRELFYAVLHICALICSQICNTRT